MKKNIILKAILAVLVLAACSSEPQWADPETHEKTEQLQKQYAPLIAGTWHFEHIAEKQRYFERLTFQENGKLSGMRKWQRRQLVTIGGEEQYTDWETMEPVNGSFSGTWQLKWERDDNGTGHNKIYLYATFEDKDYEFIAYGHNVLFNLAGEDILRFQGLAFTGNDGWTEYQRGDAEPSF